MNSDRIKEIQEDTSYPESFSVKQALLQVWNECEQERTKDCYPKEFVEFITNNIKREYHLNEKTYWLMCDQEKQFKTLDELFTYWNNIK